MDETKAYFNRMDVDRVNIDLMYSTKENGQWTKPIRVSLFDDDEIKIVDPFLSFDENYLFFSSNKLEDLNDTNDDYNIWYVKIENSQYSEPVLAEGLNSKTDDDIRNRSGIILLTCV